MIRDERKRGKTNYVIEAAPITATTATTKTSITRLSTSSFKYTQTRRLERTATTMTFSTTYSDQL